MRTLATLTKSKSLRELSTPSNFRLGQEIARRGQVEWIERSPSKVRARVRPANGQPRTVRLSATARGLSWRCTCTSPRDRLCKHAVALGLRVRRQAPRRRT